MTWSLAFPCTEFYVPLTRHPCFPTKPQDRRSAFAVKLMSPSQEHKVLPAWLGLCSSSQGWQGGERQRGEAYTTPRAALISCVLHLPLLRQKFPSAMRSGLERCHRPGWLCWHSDSQAAGRSSPAMNLLPVVSGVLPLERSSYLLF